ncbi:MAG TPA: transcription elongation factor GreA [Nitrolancea sp.]|nr:transcription elongation factor GreA [Nitrolancea sp.]
MPVERAVILTAEGKVELEQELHLLRTVKRPAVSAQIQELTMDGDVSDNSEYEDTKEELIYIEARMREIENLLRHARIAEKNDSPDVAQFGTHVTLVDENGVEESWTLVSQEEANTLHGKISTKSPVGAAILGKRVGDKVIVRAPGGESTFTVKLIE